MAKYNVEPWSRQDGKKYMSVQKIQEKYDGTPQVKRIAIPIEDWDEFVRTIVGATPPSNKDISALLDSK